MTLDQIIAAAEADPAAGKRLAEALDEARELAVAKAPRVQSMVATEVAGRPFEPVPMPSGDVLRTRAEAEAALAQWRRPDGSLPPALSQVELAVRS